MEMEVPVEFEMIRFGGLLFKIKAIAKYDDEYIDLLSADIVWIGPQPPKFGLKHRGHDVLIDIPFPNELLDDDRVYQTIHNEIAAIKQDALEEWVERRKEV